MKSMTDAPLANGRLICLARLVLKTLPSKHLQKEETYNFKALFLCEAKGTPPLTPPPPLKMKVTLKDLWVGAEFGEGDATM